VFTQPLTEVSTGNIKKLMFLGNKVRPLRGADNLTAISKRLSMLAISQHYCPPRPATGIALLDFYLLGLELLPLGRPACR
jgi:hypothetical protein